MHEPVQPIQPPQRSFEPQGGWLLSQQAPGLRPRPPGVLVILEGRNDIEFLRRISRILHRHDADIPDLNQLEQAGRLVFVSFGGGGLPNWSSGLAALGWAEVHLYDREVPPETEIRLRAARVINARAWCRAFVTTRRSLENYLDPSAIEDAVGIQVSFSDTDPVADLVAHASLPAGCQWHQLSRRARKRLRYRTKKWLNTLAVDRMTPARMAEQDPAGEVESWLRAIGRLANLNGSD
jgi:putative ATP-dependent endonuclease of OLD family